jgi:cytochrome P450
MDEPRWDPSRFPPAARANRWEQTVRFALDPIGEVMRARERHGPVFTLRLLPYKAGFVCGADAETNQEILTDQDRFVGGQAAELLEPVIGSSSLIVTPPPKHLRNRRLLLPPFHGERVAQWTERVRDLARDYLPQLATGAPVAVRPWAQRLTLDVILRVVFGVEDPARVARYRRAIDGITDQRLLALAFAPAIFTRDLGRFSPGGIFQRRRAVVDALLHEEIAARRAAPDAAQRDDVLSILLGARFDDGTGFSDEELRDELMGLVLAGHETTANALTWTLHLLAHHPAVRDALAGDLAAGSDAYLDATIKESLRLRPPVTDAVRIATRDTELGGHPVPAGTRVSAMFTATHHAPELWPEPEAFRPERHLDGKPAPYALTPFGGGVRRCLGASLAQLELETVLGEVLARALPEPAGERPETPRLSGVSIIPAEGGRIVLRQLPRTVAPAEGATAREPLGSAAPGA